MPIIMPVMHLSILAGTSSSGGYIGFTIAGTDMRGRMVYSNASSQFEWMIADNGHSKDDVEFCWIVSWCKIGIS